VTGTMVIDDLSIQLSRPVIGHHQRHPRCQRVNLTWNSASGKTYTVLFTSTLGTTTTWTPLVTGLASGGLTTSYLDSASHSGNAGFYRVMQQ
jgi:hypothetical protein